jgi:glutathionylspermidine synthase
MELAHCKWDAQVGDIATLAPFPLVMDGESWRELATLAEKLAAETELVEAALLQRRDLHAAIGLPWRLRELFADGATPTPKAARVMRFDFHWTSDGWRISEVNSDVPGGYTEATSFTRLLAEHFPSMRITGDPTKALVESILGRRHGEGRIALVNAPGHMEDHQVTAYLGARLRERGAPAEVVASSHLRWENGIARIENRWCSTRVSAIVRFYQVEWLARLPRSIAWRPFFVGARTPVTNPGTAALTESKRWPLVWDQLDVQVPTWRRLLPETRALADAPWAHDDGWVIKAAYSNTGDTVSIRDAMSSAAWRRRAWSARLRPRSWVAQRRFDVVPLLEGGERLFPCIGVYAVDGVAAGAYARVSRGLVTDASARDTALLISPTLAVNDEP